MHVIVRITSDYEDGHRSAHEFTMDAPGGNLDDWWSDYVWPLTGDGHGAGNDLGYCYYAEIVESDVPGLVGQDYEWIG